MRGYRSIPFYSIATVAMLAVLFAVSCSRPGDDMQDTKPAATAAAPAQTAPAPTPAPAAESEKSVIPEPKAATPARKSAATTMPQPMSAPDQTAANMLPPPPSEPAPIPVPTPVPQAAPPIPVPLPAPVPSSEPTIKQVTIPSGTQIYIRMIDSIASDTASTGQTFRASLDKPIVIDNQTVAPRNADVYVKLVEVQSAGKLSGTSELKVQLDRIFIGKKSYNIVSNQYLQSGASEGQKAARNVGVGAVVGGVLGGILGGKKGAVIGAGAGGGGGAVVSKGEQVHIDSETQLVFRLDNPLDVTLTIPPPSTASSTRSSSGSGGPVLLPPPPDGPGSRNSSNSSSNNPNNSNNNASNSGDVSGTWSVTTDATQGASMRLVLRQNGSNLQGTITNPSTGGTIPVQGNIDGNFVTFSTSQNSAMPMQYSGAISGDSMQGTVLLPVNNNGGVYGGNTGGIGLPGGYPTSGGGRRGGGGARATTQAHWNAQRMS